jgi:hypothetical protein
MNTTTTEIRRLLYQVIEGHRKTGQILERAPPARLASILDDYGMSTEHADACIDLHRLWFLGDWSAYETINQWWCEAGHHSPQTPNQALNMLRAWRSHLH